MKVYVDGAWVEKTPDWRGALDLAACNRPQLYAAGLEDGYRNCLADLRSLAGLEAVARLFVEHWVALDLERREGSWGPSTTGNRNVTGSSMPST